MPMPVAALLCYNHGRSTDGVGSRRGRRSQMACFSMSMERMGGAYTRGGREVVGFMMVELDHEV
jgi:hypothetical protein